MTDDLVKRLRDSCYLAFDDNTNDYATAIEAADRIEQLEAALREIKEMTPDPEFGTLPIDAAIKVALAALGEKKDAE
jgi:hypothetical protein